jgi:hypothetical protein
LQPGGEVWRFAHDRLFLRRALADQIADDDQPGGNADTGLELNRPDIEASDGIGEAQPGADRTLGIVLVRLRIEISEHTVAHVFSDKPVKAPYNFGYSTMVFGDDLA